MKDLVHKNCSDRPKCIVCMFILTQKNRNVGSTLAERINAGYKLGPHTVYSGHSISTDSQQKLSPVLLGEISHFFTRFPRFSNLEGVVA